MTAPQPFLILLLALGTLPPSLARADDPPAPKAEAPSEPDPLAEARALTDKEEWEPAETLFHAFLDAHPSSPRASEARFWTGFCQVKLDQNEKAAETLRPFLNDLAKDKWADDALLQLGKAYAQENKEPQALEAWKRHLEHYPDSVWHAEVLHNIIDQLFDRSVDLAECLAYCERLVKDAPDRDTIGEARYQGAYCLNALRRFDESAAWAERHFDPESPLEEAWRRLLNAQGNLLRGRLDSALKAVDSLNLDFPDLDHDARRDLLVKTCHVLRYNGRADRARELLLDELNRSSGRPEDEVSALFDALADVNSQDRPASYLGALEALAADPKTPLFVRVVARERLAQALKDDGKAQQAQAVLRAALTDDQAEYLRVRVATRLAELIAESEAEKPAALKVLEDLLPKLARRDLILQIKKAADDLRPSKE